MLYMGGYLEQPLVYQGILIKGFSVRSSAKLVKLSVNIGFCRYFYPVNDWLTNFKTFTFTPQ